MDEEETTTTTRVIKRRKRRAKQGKPSHREWSGISRTIYNNTKEMLEERDEDGRLMCNPALLTAASKLVLEAEVLVEPPSAKGEMSKLEKQLQAKREKRKLKPAEDKPVTIKDHDMGYLNRGVFDKNADDEDKE